MSKSKRRRKDDYDESREERILNSFKKIRKPTPPPGKFHTEKVKPDEEVDLEEIKDLYNQGVIDDD